MHAQSATFEQWIAQARGRTVRSELERRGLLLRSMLGDAGVPCPGCGGRDRFAVNFKKNVWNCRASGIGGDAIALAQHIDGSTFLVAVETVLAEPPPRGGSALTEEKQREIEAHAASQRAAEADRLRRDAESTARFRERERKAAREIWDAAGPLAGTPAEAYLRLRGLVAPAGARLRYEPCAPLWDAPGGRVIYRGPALVAAIQGPDGRFSGVQRIWIDLDQPKGKALVADPRTGELAAAKKTRGSIKGGSILLRSCCLPTGFPGDFREPSRLFLGEGIETVLSVFSALLAARSPLLEGAEFRAAVSLGNLCGRAAGRVKHPSLKRPDKNGVARPIFLPDNEPAGDNDFAIIPVPASVRDLWLLGDGDSEPLFTRLALERAGKRLSRAFPWLTIWLRMAAPGFDFNDMWRARQVEIA